MTRNTLALCTPAEHIGAQPVERAPYVRPTNATHGPVGWRVLVNYGAGWEFEVWEATYKNARQRIREYRENAPEYPVRIVRGRPQ